MHGVLDKLGININVSFHLIFFSLIWVRILMVFSVIPFLFGKPVPKRVAVAASFAFAAFAYIQIVPSKPPPLPNAILTLVMLYVKEIFYGLSIGISVSIIFHAFAGVGQMIDNQRGVSIARVLIPQLGTQASISALLLFQLGIVLYLTMGGHIVFLDGLFMSFKELSPLSFPSIGPSMYALVDMFMRLTGKVIYIAIQMSTPVLIVIFLTDMILGLANRIAPQINVWMLGFTVKGYVGTVMMLIAITVIGDQMMYYGKQANVSSSMAIRLLKGDIPQDMPTSPMPQKGIRRKGDGPINVESR